MKLQEFGKVLALLGVAGVAAGCAATHQTSIMPRADGSYDMVSTDAREDSAYKNAERDAEDHCKQQNKKFVAMKHDSAYQGVEKKEKQEVEATDVAMAWVTGSSHKRDRSDDYKVTMHFKCE